MLSLIGPGEVYAIKHHFPEHARATMRQADLAILAASTLFTLSLMIVCARGGKGRISILCLK